MRRNALIAAKTVRKYYDRIIEMVDDPPAEVHESVKIANAVIETFRAAALEPEQFAAAVGQ